jgi:hypothetical protein
MNHAMHHVRFMISPELFVVQETLTFEIGFSSGGFKVLAINLLPEIYHL